MSTWSTWVMRRNFSRCLKTGNIPELRRLLKSNGSLQARTNEHGETLLMMAIDRRRIGCAFACLEDPGISTYLINDRDTSGRQNTALHRAAKRGMFELVCAIVKSGANLKTRDGHDLDAACVAQNNGHGNIAKFLRGIWMFQHWSPQIHPCAPFEFQREVWHCVIGCPIIAKGCSKDIKTLIFEALLQLHRNDYIRASFI